MAQLAPKAVSKTAHLEAFPRLKAFRENVGETEFEHWVGKSTDGRGKNSHLDILLAEYERLNLDPMSCTLISTIRGYDEKALQTITKTAEAKLILSERDPQFGGVIHGEVVFAANGITPISATAYAIRRNSPEPSKATVWFSECQQLKDNRPLAVWATRPAGMLMKCAVAAVLKLAFPTACAGIEIKNKPEPGYEKPVVKSPVRLVDTTTGEVFAKSASAQTAQNAPPAAPRVAHQSITAGATVTAPGAATTVQPAPKPPISEPVVPEPVVPEPAASANGTSANGTSANGTSANGTGARVTGGKVFEHLARDPDRLPLVQKVYDFMGLVAREVDEAQHRMTMRIVAGVAKIAVVPERWVDFPIAALTSYITSQEPPIEEELPFASGMTKEQAATLENLVATNAISEKNLKTLVSKLTNGQSESFYDLSPAKADQAAALIVDWLEARRAQEQERAQVKERVLR